MHADKTMTVQQQNQSQFNQRADNAAVALKGRLSQENNVSIPERKVEVGPDGQPPKPPPPEGSYARQAYDRMRHEQQAQSVQMMQHQGQPTPEQQLGNQPLAGTQEQALDGSQAPPLQQQVQQPQAPEAQPLSPSAQDRFQKLTQDLRDKDRELQMVLERSKTNETSLAETKAAMEALQRQHQQMLQANLENLDPETRLQVMQDARMQEYLAAFEQKLLSKIQPQIQGLQENRAHDELMKLSDKYPAFDALVHGPLIEMFRGKNQHASVEQAYKAIAEPGELVTRGSVPANAVPPVVTPRASMQSPQSRYVPEPESDPVQEMQEEAAQIRQLMRSTDPSDHKTGSRLIHKNLMARLANQLPGSR